MKQKIGIMLLISSLIITCFTGCESKKELYQVHKSGYKEIKSMEGVTFDIPETALSLATAVTSISEDMDFDPANVYLYKDGESQYLLFSMDSMVIAIQKGTRFQIKNAEDKEIALQKEKLMNIWFEKEGKNFLYRESRKNGYKLIGKVLAQVSVTDELYNDFVGELAIIEGEEEWALFIGAPGSTYDELSKKQKQMIEHVSGSLAFSERNRMESSVQKDDKTAEIETISEVEEAKEKEIANVSNSGSESSIYNLLKIGETGKAMALSATGSDFTKIMITIDQLFTDEEAVSLIKSGLQEAGEEYQEPPSGCTWNIIEYSLDTPIDKAYMNIKLKGMDGEKLKYRGISYSQRTFDIFNKISKSKNRYTKFYCYYAVPNGCKEYMLECGDGTINTMEAGITSAYYKIK